MLKKGLFVVSSAFALLGLIPLQVLAVDREISGGIISLNCENIGGVSIASWTFTTGDPVIYYSLRTEFSNGTFKLFQDADPDGFFGGAGQHPSTRIQTSATLVEILQHASGANSEITGDNPLPTICVTEVR
jgi:hypothetical protein